MTTEMENDFTSTDKTLHFYRDDEMPCISTVMMRWTRLSSVNL